MTEHLLTKAAYESRGRIIQLAIEMESMMEIYIAERFVRTGDKIEELIITIISRLTLNAITLVRFKQKNKRSYNRRA
jgi:hypothetical protein